MRKGLKSFTLIFLSGIMLALVFPDVHARDRHWPYSGRYYDVNHRGNRFVYHNGLFFRRAGARFIVAAPPIGAIIPVLPFGSITFAFGPGIAYYFMDGVYYRSVPQGYVIVPESEVLEYKRQRALARADAQTQEKSAGGEYTVNVPNSDGTYTPVTLRKSGNGYTGPQGEFYNGNPTVEQLKVLYGK